MQEVKLAASIFSRGTPYQCISRKYEHFKVLVNEIERQSTQIQADANFATLHVIQKEKMPDKIR